MQQREKPFRGSTPQPDHIMLSFYDDPKTTMAVTWRTSVDVTQGYVLYRAQGESDWQRCEAYYETFESDIDSSNIFWCRLKGLKPGTSYSYSCGDEANRSGAFRFATEPERLTKFKFICVSDQQKGGHEKPDYSWFNGFLKQLLKEHPDTRFILTGGDNTDCGQHEVQWNGALLGLEGIMESTPFMMALGNHDNRGFDNYALGTNKYYSEPAEFFSKQFKGSYPDNGPTGWKTENYTFDYGNVHLSVVGINGPEDVNRWMIADLSATKQTWKLGCYHFPICYSGTDCENYDAYPDMREGFELFDLVFSGHEHNFSRSFPLKNEELFDRPSQGTIHYMLGNSHQNPPGSRTVSKIWHSAFYPQEEQNAMVAIVEVEGDTLKLTSVLNDGRIVDQCIINKQTDTITPYAVAPRFNRTRMMFKGMDPGLSQASTPCEQKDGVWFAPLATLISFIGGEVRKTKGQVELELYGHSVTFREGEATAQTEQGEFPLEAPVYRGHREQLYIPASACEAFGMRWAYAPRNNFISFEHPSNDKPVTVQP